MVSIDVNQGRVATRALLCGAAVAASVFALAIGSEVGSKERKHARSRADALALLSRARLSNVELQSSAFDSLLFLTATVTNDNPVDLVDLEITCRHVARDGGEADTTTTTFSDVVPAHSTGRINYARLGFVRFPVASSECHLSDTDSQPAE